jgi:hypothetical protein
MAKTVDADGDQPTSEAEVACFTRPHRSGGRNRSYRKARVSDDVGACPVTQHPQNTSALGNICDLFLVASLNILVRRNSVLGPVHRTYALIDLDLTSSSVSCIIATCDE